MRLTKQGCELNADATEAAVRLLPSHLRGGLLGYVRARHPVGGFLAAVLGNDLFDACGRADHVSAAELPAICWWIQNYAPRTCHGSREAVDAWLRADGWDEETPCETA